MTEPEPQKHRVKRKVQPGKSGGKGIVIALGIGGAVLVVGVGVALAMFVFKKDPKLSDQQALVSDENKSSESEDNGSLVPENTPGALTNSVANPEIDSSNNLDLPVGKRQEWTYGTGKMDILKIYKGKTTNLITKVFGEPNMVKHIVTTKGPYVIFSYDQMKVLKGGKQYSKVNFIMPKEAIGDAKVETVTVVPNSVVARAPAGSATKQTEAEYEQKLKELLGRYNRQISSGLDGKSVAPFIELGYDAFKTACNSAPPKLRYQGFMISRLILIGAGTWLTENYDKTKKGVGVSITLDGKRISTAKDMAEFCLFVFAGAEMASHALLKDPHTSAAVLRDNPKTLKTIETSIFVNELRLKDDHRATDRDVKIIRDAGYSKLQKMLNNQ